MGRWTGRRRPCAQLLILCSFGCRLWLAHAVRVSDLQEEAEVLHDRAAADLRRGLLRRARARSTQKLQRPAPLVGSSADDGVLSRGIGMHPSLQSPRVLKALEGIDNISQDEEGQLQESSCPPDPDGYVSPQEARAAMAEVLRELAPDTCAAAARGAYEWNCSAEHICSAPGVECTDDDPRELSLFSARCGQDIQPRRFPKALQHIPRLEVIAIRKCGLVGPLPQWIFRCPLRYLDLDGNQLSGKISWPQEAEAVRSLKSFQIGENAFDGGIPPGIGMAQQLRHLVLDHNRLSGPIPEEIAELVHLESIKVDNNSLSGPLPAGLSKLKGLELLTANGNRLRGPMPNLSALERLMVLQLGENEFELDDLSWLPAKELSSLNLDNNKLRGDILRTLPNLSQVNTLSFHGNDLNSMIPDATLAGMKDLEFLDLGSNKLEGHIPAVLGKLKNLLLLGLNENRFSGTLPPELGNLPNLRMLDVGDNLLGGELPESFSKLQSLEYFNADKNRLTGHIPPGWGRLQSLLYLVLRRNQLSGVIPASLANASKLISLALDQNEFVGQIPASFGNLTQLEVLLLYDNRLTGEIPEELSTLKNLNFFAVHANDLSGSLPDIRLRPCRTHAVSEGCFANWSLLTLHGNRLSCKLPSMLGDRLDLRGSVAVGNKFSGPRPTWLAPHLADRIHLIEVSRFDILLACSLTGLAVFLAYVAVVLRGSLVSFLRSLVQDLVHEEGSVAGACNRYALVSLAQLFVVSVCMEALYVACSTYVKCGTRLGRFSIAYLEISRQFGATGLACLLLWFVHITIAARRCNLLRQTLSGIAFASTFWAWLAWILVLAMFSAAPVGHAVLSTLPYDNVLKKDMGDETWLSLYMLLPSLGALLNSVVLPLMAESYSARTGITYETLLAVSHATVVWISPAAAVLAMDENCGKRWRRFWNPCQPYGPSLGVDMSLRGYDSTDRNLQFTFLSTEELCSVPSPWTCFDGGCTRQVVEIAQRFTLQQLVVEAVVLPTWYLFLWSFCKLSEDGRLMLPLVKMPAPTFTGKDYTLRLNVWLATAFFWGPLVPVVMPMLLVVVMTNTLLQRIETHHFNRKIEDEKELEHSNMSRTFQMSAICMLCVWLLLFLSENEAHQRRFMY
eukprot:gb/GFBE01035127.1/.p1 GENE.gb/GFBE01035127.1/~~gb/GFBE01035127.1/.p1  ORF type:complete len:1130 (+),score=207.57 gb/GFBE01035127.1/:1-3390(+)